MVRVISLWLLTCSLAQAQEESAECNFHRWWAAKALYIAQELQLPPDRWHIVPEGYTKEGYDIIIAIKREAYNDIPALARRVTRACAPKVPT